MGSGTLNARLILGHTEAENQGRELSSDRTAREDPADLACDLLEDAVERGVTE